MSDRWIVRCDFDNTMTDRDTCDFVLKNLAGRAWEEIEARWESGEIDANQCMVEQARLIAATPDEVEALLAQVKLDPYFKEFLRTCEHWQVPVRILSDGYDFNIKRILRSNGLDELPYDANQLEYLGAGKFAFTSLHTQGECASGHYACKCRRITGEYKEILIGDGRSDFCAAEKADLVIAKDSLLTYCKRKGLRHLPFTNFRDVARILSRLFMEAKIHANSDSQYRQRFLCMAGEVE